MLGWVLFGSVCVAVRGVGSFLASRTASGLSFFAVRAVGREGGREGGRERERVAWGGGMDTIV